MGSNPATLATFALYALSRHRAFVVHLQDATMLVVSIAGDGVRRFTQLARELGDGRARSVYSRAINDTGAKAATATGRALADQSGLAKRVGEHRSIVLSLLVIGLATVSRLFLNSTLELIVSAISAGVGIALIQALMPAAKPSSASTASAESVGISWSASRPNPTMR